MHTLVETIVKEQKRLSELLAQSNKNLNKYKNVEDVHVQTSIRKGYEQYYLYDPKSKKRKYIKHDELKKYTKSIQKDYETTVNKMLKKKNKAFEKILKYDKDLDMSDIKLIYGQMPDMKKRLIKPLIEDDEMYIERWLDEHPGNKNTYKEGTSYKTNRGEFVRSKSEKIIADALEKHGVPYQYEPLVELDGYHTVFPDFIALNVRTKETYYWEHLGIVSDLEYASKNLQKIQQYDKNGIKLGENLIITIESKENPLMIQGVEDRIIRFLL